MAVRLAGRMKGWTALAHVLVRSYTKGNDNMYRVRGQASVWMAGRREAGPFAILHS